MAAGLQCLTATSPVLRHFLELQQRGEKLPPPGSLMANFSSLLSKMWSGKYNVLQPTEFKQTLGVYHSQFKDYRQVWLIRNTMLYLFIKLLYLKIIYDYLINF
jgi:hypothetical protein